MMRCTCLSGTPVTQAASLADNVPCVVLALIIFPPLRKEYRGSRAALRARASPGSWRRRGCMAPSPYTRAQGRGGGVVVCPHAMVRSANGATASGEVAIPVQPERSRGWPCRAGCRACGDAGANRGQVIASLRGCCPCLRAAQSWGASRRFVSDANVVNRSVSRTGGVSATMALCSQWRVEGAAVGGSEGIGSGWPASPITSGNYAACRAGTIATHVVHDARTALGYDLCRRRPSITRHRSAAA